MGIEAVGTAQLMNTMRDFFPVKAVLVVARNGFKLVGGQQRIVEVDLADVFSLNDDIHIVFADIDVVVFVIEGGEGNLVDALLDGCDPHHRRGSVAPTVRAGVEKINGAAMGGFQVT